QFAPSVKQIAFSSATYSVDERAGGATITIVRSSGKGSVSVTFSTVSGGSAGAGTDYFTTTQLVKFKSGQTSQTVNVAIIDDGAAGGGDVPVTLAPPTPGGGWQPASPATAVLTIHEDPAPTQPTNLAAFAAGPYAIGLTWDDQPGIANLLWTISRSTTMGGPY